MIEQPFVDDIEYLRTVNLQLADWELQGPRASRDEVAAVLDEQFRFRRAKGGAVDRDGFLDGLTDGKNRSRRTAGRASGKFRSSGSKRLSRCSVYLNGLRGGNVVNAWFRNLRIWEKQADGRWRCVFWFNKPLG